MQDPEGYVDALRDERDKASARNIELAFALIACGQRKARLAGALEALLTAFEEAHQAEVDSDHGGDEGECSYCYVQAQARRALEQEGLR